MAKAQGAKSTDRQRVLIVTCRKPNRILEGQSKCLHGFRWCLVKLCKEPPGKRKVSRKSNGLKREPVSGLRLEAEEDGTEKLIHFSVSDSQARRGPFDKLWLEHAD